ncbi:MAG: hypothetical protein WBL50_15980 [Candidatus Acidiferrum sp.]
MLESAVLPRIHPMRLRIAKAFNDPEYIFELKHDGFRALAYVEEGKCRLVSRNSNLFKSFESLKKSLGELRDFGRRGRGRYSNPPGWFEQVCCELE